MAQSYVQYQGDGTSTTFTVPFPFIVRSHVKLYLGYNVVDRTFDSELTEGPDFSWTSDTIAELVSAPASSEELTIIRITPSNTQVVQWQDGSNLIAFDLNTSDLQNLYVVQEQEDRNDAGLTAAAASASTAASQASAAAASAAAAVLEAQDAEAAANAATSAANAVTTTANAAAAAAASAVQIATAAAAPISALQVLEPLQILLNATAAIGRPGTIPFGVGPALPAGLGVTGIAQADYYPVHLASGSFI